MTDFKQDDEETPVIFRKYGARRGGDVIALFPAEAAHVENDGMCSCYAHVGQHGSADPWAVINQTRPATPEEYASLKAELEGRPYGYRLKVYTRLQRSFREAREAQCREWQRRRA